MHKHHQELVRYQTEALNVSLTNYPAERVALHEAYVSYPTGGALHGDAAEFAFPLTRETAGGAVSIQAQCEGLLRTRVWSHTTAARGDTLTLAALNALFGSLASGQAWESAGTAAAPPETGRVLVHDALARALAERAPAPRFSAAEWAGFGIADLAVDHVVEAAGQYWRPVAPDDGGPWHPLARDAPPGAVNFSRAHVVHALVDHDHTERWWEGLYDARIVPSASQFCTDDAPPSTASPPYAETDAQDVLTRVLGQGMDLRARFDMDNLIAWVDWGARNRTVGAMHAACPCVPAGYEGPVAAGSCLIPRVVCVALGASGALPPRLREACARLDVQDTAQVVAYPQHEAGLVRAALRAHGPLDMPCSTFGPSTLWGLAEHSGADLLWHAASGVTMRNIRHVSENLWRHIGESDRELHMASPDGATTLGVPACDTTDAARVEAEAFPAVHVVPESPALLACARFLVESVWEQALRVHGVTGLELSHAEEARALWRVRCAAKIDKLRSCQELGAYGATVPDSAATPDCPFTVDAREGELRLLRDACLVTDLQSGSGRPLYDPFACRTAVGLGDAELRVRRTWLSDACRVANPLHMLAGDAPGLADVPGLSVAFAEGVLGVGAESAVDTESAKTIQAVRAYLFPEAGADATRWFDRGEHVPPGDDYTHVLVGLRDKLTRSVRAEHAGTIVVLTADEAAALVPAEAARALRASDYVLAGGRYWQPGARLAAAEHAPPGAHFHSVPYWPQHWQYPLGEALTEHPEYMAGFANYMALVDGEVRVAAGLARALYADEPSAQFYGTTGQCREHTVGMPLKDLNTHRLCTSTSMDQGPASCSASAAADAGGGHGPVLGPLFQVARLWLATDGFRGNVNDNPRSDPTYEDFLRHTGASDHARDTGAARLTPLAILHEQCNTDPATIARALDARSTVSGARVVQCTRTSECAAARGEVCHAGGTCGPIEVVVRNDDEARIEFGVVSPACDASPRVSGASPWKRARHFLAQHGMCAHRYAVTYERMLLALAAPNNTRQACTLRQATTDDALGLEWVEHVGPGTGRDLGNVYNESVDSLRQHISNPVQQKMSLATWRSFGITDLGAGDYVQLNTIDAPYMVPNGNRTFEYFECARNVTEWDWVREKPGWWGERSAAVDQTTAETVGELGELDLDPHPCDYEPLHAQDWGWCSVSHAAGQEEGGGAAYTHWLRLAASHDNFTVLRDQPDPRVDISQDSMAWNKLRFLGLERLALRPRVGPDSRDKDVRVTQCQNFGVCESGDFTVGGVRGGFHRFFFDRTANASRFYKMDNVELCGPMGVHRGGTTCELDPAVTTLFHTVHGDASPPCRSVFTGMLVTGTAQGVSSLLRDEGPTLGWRYETTQRESVRALLNRFFALDFGLQARPTGAQLHGDLLRCAEDLVRVQLAPNSSLQLLIADKGRTKYDLHPEKTAGVYIFLDFIALEVPVLWWLKYALERIFFARQGADGVFVLNRASMATPWFDAERLADQKMEVPLDAYAHRGRLEPGLSIRGLWASINSVATYPLAAVKNVFFATMARWLHSVLDDTVKFGRYKDLVLPGRDVFSASQPPLFMRCFERTVFAASTPQRDFAHVCLTDESDTRSVADLTLAYQFLHPVVSSPDDAGSTMFVPLDSTNIYVPAPLDDTDAPVIQLYQTLFREIFEQMAPSEQAKALLALSPYTERGLLTPDLGAANQHLPVLRLEMPDSSLWVRYLESALEPAIRAVFDIMDEEFPHGFEPPSPSKAGDAAASECLFSRNEVESMRQRAMLTYEDHGGVDISWPDTHYEYEGGSVQFNMCEATPRVTGARNLQSVHTSKTSRGPTCGLGRGMGSNPDSRLYQAFPVSDPTETMFVHSLADGAPSELKSKLDTDFCGGDYTCCPDDLVLQSLSGTTLEAEAFQDLYFGSVYTASHRHFAAKTEQNDAEGKRCIRTDSSCFRNPSENLWGHVSTVWKRGAEGTCAKKVKITAPPEFRVQFFKRNTKMRFNEVVYNDRVVMDQSRSTGGRRFLSLMHTGTAEIPVFPTPAASFCPSMDEIETYAMHKFMPLYLADVREKYQAAYKDGSPWSRINAKDSFWTNFDKFETNFTETNDDRVYVRRIEDLWIAFDYQERKYQADNVIGKSSALCGDVDLDPAYCEYRRKMDKARQDGLLCDPSGSGTTWTPNNVRTSLYDFGKCYDADIVGEKFIDKDMVTACEYLSHVFSGQYVDYFMTEFMGADAKITETRITELFEPLDPTLQSLTVRAGESTQRKNAIHGEISAARFRYLNEDQEVVLGLIAQDTWREFCSARGIAGLCIGTSGDPKTMMQRHRMSAYRWGKDATELADPYVPRIAPCVPKRAHPDVYSEEGRLYGACGDWVFSGIPTETSEKKCWDECGKKEGECQNFCGDGACCRKNFGSLKVDMDWSSGPTSRCRVADFRDCTFRLFEKRDSKCLYMDQTAHHSCVRVDRLDQFTRTCLPAVDTAMDVLDKQGFCRGGGSRTQLDVMPQQWQRISKILTADESEETIVWVPCPPECDANPSVKAVCKLCESVLVRATNADASNTENTDQVTSAAPRVHSIDEACSFEIALEVKYVCGASLHEAWQTYSNKNASNINVDVFTRYAANGRYVAWNCEPCHTYNPQTPQTFASMGGKNKVGYGLFHNNRVVSKDSDAFGSLREAIRTAMESTGDTGSTESLAAHLNASIAEQNTLNENLTPENAQEGRHAPMYLSVGDTLTVHHVLGDLQTADFALPSVLRDAYREFGSAESLPLSTQGCALERVDGPRPPTRCGRLMQTAFRTHDAHAKSVMLQQALLQGCRVDEDSPIFNEHECTPLITHADTRYNRLRAFQRDVLGRQFGLALPLVAPATAARLDVNGVDWTRGMLAFFARAERDILEPDDVYLDHLFNDAENCWHMYQSDSSFRGVPVSIQDMPCFEDFNKSVHLLNPWLGGNYSFPRHLLNFYDYLELKAGDNQFARVAAGFDLCLRGQTLQGGNVQPCQAETCIGRQNADELHPDDVNRTVCKWSARLNEAYSSNEFFEVYAEQTADDMSDNLGILYAAPTTRSPCDKEYRTAAGSTCQHAQALLGFAPADRGRMRAAPSLNRTKYRVDHRIQRDVFRMGGAAANLSQSLWAGERLGIHREGYGALAVDPAELAPARIEMRVDGGARNLLVYAVAWRDSASGGGGGPRADWIRTGHARGMRADRDTLDANPLYHARVRNQTHWSCPLLLREALTGSPVLHALHPETHLLAPDPVQAARLYPGLSGLHPAYRLARVQREDLAQYRMVGLRELRHASTLSAAVTLEAARRMIEDTLDSQRKYLRVHRGPAAAAATQCLQWPHTHAGGTLRSGEEVGTLSACPPGHQTDLGGVLDNHTQIWIEATADLESGTARGPASAGVCYRAPLAKMTRAQWDALQVDGASGFLKCRRIDRDLVGNATRTIRCWSGGAQPPTDLVLETTDVRTASPGAFRRALERPRSRPDPPPAATHADEVSLGVRRRISPLRARMRRAGLAHLEPGALWARAAPHVACVPVAPDNQSTAAFARPWGGRDCAGAPRASMPYREWVDADTRADRCHAMLDDERAGAGNLSCASQSVDLDLCELTEMRPVCEYLTEVRRRAGYLNARRAGFLRGSAHYYTPSTFHHDDGEFASRAVAAYYNTLGIQQCDAWSDPVLELVTSTPELCSENIVTTVIEFLRYLRQVLLAVVDLFFVISELGGNSILSVALHIASAAAPGSEILAAMANQVTQDVFNGVVELFEILLEFIGELGTAIIQLLLRTFADWIEAAIQAFCYLTELIITAVADFLRGLASVLAVFGQGVTESIQSAAENMENNHEEWMEVCLGTQLQSFIGRTFDETSYVALIADGCFAGPLTAQGGLATGFFGGVQNPLVCTDSSMCLREAVSALGTGGGAEAMPAIACVQCPERRYGCNTLVGSGTCACGVQNAQRTPDECSTSAACEGPDAQCLWSDTGDIDGESLSAASCAGARRNGRLPSCVLGRSSGSTAVCVALPGNVVSLLARADDGTGLTRRFVAVLPAYIPNGARVAFADVAVMPLVLNLQFYGTRVLELDACEDGLPCRIVAVEPPQRRRRLLDWLAAPVPAARRLQATASDRADADARVPNASSWWFVDIDLPSPPFVFTELAPAVPCIRTGYIEFDAFLLRAVLRMAGDGWRAKTECSGPQSVTDLLQNTRCDLLTSVVDRLARNSVTLARYFRGNPCFINTSTSCIQPPRGSSARTSSSALWPGFSAFDFAAADVTQWYQRTATEAGFPDGKARVRLTDSGLATALLAAAAAGTRRAPVRLDNYTPSAVVGMKHYVLAGEDQFWPVQSRAAAATAVRSPGVAAFPVQLAQDVMRAVLSVFDARRDFYTNLLANIVSLEAVGNDDEYAFLVRHHEFSLGRIVREAITCDFDTSITCAQQNNGILLSFVTMFAFILVITLLLPVPSVPLFFLWTLGLTVGVTYLAYGYSPFCFPMVPNCLGHGIQELMHSLLPQNLSIPVPLLHADNCQPSGQRLVGRDGPCLRSCSELPNPVGDALDVVLVAEALFSSAPNLGSKWQLVQTDPAVSHPLPPGTPSLVEQELVRCATVLALEPTDRAWLPCTLNLTALRAEERADFFRTLDPTKTYTTARGLWRPRGGLFVAEFVLDGVRMVAQSILTDTALWQGLEVRIEHAVQNARASERDTPSQIFSALCFCLALHGFEVIAWLLLAILLLPVLLSSVQYFLALNILLLQFAIEGLFFDTNEDEPEF